MTQSGSPDGQVRGTASRREREKAQRRDDILQAARGVFFQRGFHTVTVDDIAAAAEVGKGTVYLYFDAKETILAHLLLEGLDKLVAELEAAYSADRRLAARTRLRRMADAYLKFFQQNPEYYRLLMAFDRGQIQASIDPDIYQEVHTRSLYGIQWLERAVTQAQEEDLITVKNPREAAGVLWAGLNGVLVLLSHPLRAEIIATDLESLYGTMTEVLIDGLGK
jgi:AcrR family transcriptional regulator